MKRALLLIFLCVGMLLSSCHPPSLAGEQADARSVAVNSDSFWVEAGGEVYRPLPLDEQSFRGGGIGPWDGQTASEGIPWEQTEISGLSYYGGEWYACERLSEDCRGDGAQLLRWDASEKEQKRILSLCSCEGSRYLLYQDWVFYTLRCEAEGVMRGLYGYHRTKESYCFFEGEIAGLGLRDGVPHYLLLNAEGAALYRLEEDAEGMQSLPVAAWDELVLGQERLKKGEVFFFDALTVSAIPEEGLVLFYDDATEGRLFQAEISSVGASSGELFFACQGDLFRWEIAQDRLSRLASFPVKEAEFTLFSPRDGTLLFELRGYQAVDVWLWRWEQQYLMLWQEEHDAHTVSMRQQLTALSASQLPWGVGFPTVF